MTSENMASMMSGISVLMGEAIKAARQLEDGKLPHGYCSAQGCCYDTRCERTADDCRFATGEGIFRYVAGMGACPTPKEAF